MINTIGKNIRDRRLAEQLTQATVAARMRARGFENFYAQTVLKVEKGIRALRAEEVTALADVLRTSPEALLGEVVPRSISFTPRPDQRVAIKITTSGPKASVPVNGQELGDRIPRDKLHVGWQDGYPVVTCELWDDVTMDLDEATLKVISPRIEAELIRQLDDILVELRHVLNGKDTDTAISIAHGIGVAAEIIASRKKLLESGQAS